MEERDLMEEKDLNVIARRENSNTAGWFIAGVVFLVTSIIGIALFFSRNPHDWGFMAMFVMSLPIALFSLIYAFWDAGNPDALIIMEDDGESINVYSKSKWISIRISDIITVNHWNYVSGRRSFSSGFISIQTTDGYYKVKNIQNVADVCYELKSLAEKTKK